jgi:hypothetical protein
VAKRYVGMAESLGMGGSLAGLVLEQLDHNRRASPAPTHPRE